MCLTHSPGYIHENQTLKHENQTLKLLALVSFGPHISKE